MFCTLDVVLRQRLSHLRSSTERKIGLLPSMAIHIYVTTCDAYAADHVVRFTRPSPSIYAYCKRSKNGAGEGLGTGLRLPHSRGKLGVFSHVSMMQLERVISLQNFACCLLNQLYVEWCVEYLSSISWICVVSCLVLLRFLLS